MQMIKKLRKNTKPKSSIDGIEILKQIQDDFYINELLSENKQQNHNHQYFIEIINSLNLNNHKKKQKIYHLRKSEIQFPTSSNEKDYPYYESKFQQIGREKYLQEDIRRELNHQICQITKTINLLKGDIDHFVHRNQSANLLASKICKVKIVADDQFQKVQSAFRKDRDEIKIRDEMQNKFNSKLKDISKGENNSLAKLKKKFVSTQRYQQTLCHKLQTFDKINNQLSNGDQKQKQAFQKNLYIETCLLEFQDIAKLISNDKQWLLKMENQSFSEFKKYIVSIELMISTKFQQLIDINRKINSKYNLENSNRQELQQQLKHMEAEIAKMEMTFIQEQEEKFKYNQKQSQMFDQKMKLFYQNFKVYCVLMEFVGNNQYIINLKQNKIKKEHKTDGKHSKFYRQQKNRISYDSQKILQQKEKSSTFTNRLSKNYLILLQNNLDFQALQQIQNPSKLYKEIQVSLIGWFKNLKDKITQLQSLKASQNKYLSDIQKSNKTKFNKAKSMECSSLMQMEEKEVQDQNVCLAPTQNEKNINNNSKTISFPKIIEEEESIDAYTQEKSSSQTDQQEIQNASTKKIIKCKLFKSIHNEPIRKKHKKLFSQGNAEESHQSQSPQRIQLIEHVNKSYFHMLKSTLQMEKQNTRKNYEFMRGFKRSKFTQRNALQEQKRFQAKFALEFIRKQQKIAVQINSKNIIPASQNSSSRNMKIVSINQIQDDYPQSSMYLKVNGNNHSKHRISPRKSQRSSLIKPDSQIERNVQNVSNRRIPQSNRRSLAKVKINLNNLMKVNDNETQG